MESLRWAVIVMALTVGLALIAGCEKGPAQKVGESVDRAVGEDRLFSKGPAEKAGKKVDKAVDDLKR